MGDNAPAIRKRNRSAQKVDLSTRIGPPWPCSLQQGYESWDEI